MNNISKVHPGDPLAIPAAAYNAFVDAARANQADGNALLQVPQSAFQQSGIILVRNDSGADRDRFDVLGIDSPVIDPADDEDAYKNRVVLAGVVPTVVDHAARFVVLLEPVASGDVGRACVSGVCPAWVNFQTEGDAFADVYDNDSTQLKGGAAGAAQVLWKQEGTGPLWAVVRLGGGAGGSPAHDLLNGEVHADTIDAAPVPGDMVCARQANEKVLWQRLAIGGGGMPLRVSADGEPAWFDGPSFTQDVPDGVPYWEGNTLKQKYRTWTITKGVVTARGEEQIATILSKSTFQCPE